MRDIVVALLVKEDFVLMTAAPWLGRRTGLTVAAASGQKAKWDAGHGLGSGRR
jgi:hypothetical protein